MAISNTSIQIRRSTTTGVPSGGTLKAGEIAYSYTSNTLFLGTSGGNAVVNIGGSYYTTTLDAATSSNTASTLVKRDPTGTFSGNLIGSSSNTFTLVNPQNFSITGDVLASAVSFNGSSAVALSSALNTINPNVGTFGSTTAVPVITVTANGRITSVTTSTISTSFNVSDSTTSNTVAGGTTLTFYGTKGVTTTVANPGESITFGTDSTVARTNTSNIGAQVFNTDVNLPTNNMSVGGTLTVSNLSVSGNITYANSISTLNISDPIIYLASNNSGNLVDIGMVGHFVGAGHSGDTSHYQHTGFVRDYNDNKWKLFSNVSTEPTTTVNFAEANTVYDVIKTGGLDASNGNITFVNSISAGSLSLTTPLGISSGGTNGSSFTNNQITYFNGTSIVSLANSTYSNTGTYGTNTTLAGLTVDGFGRVTAASWQPISGLTVSQGGTGQSSFTSGQIIVGSGTNGLAQLANTGIISFTETSNSTITSVSVDAYGRTTSIVSSAIAGLTVGQGGTGQSTFTTNGITYGNGTGPLQVTAAAGTSDQTWSNQILTVTNAGVPVWSTTMDGGTF
jgi:hypothetical protein